MNCNVHFTCRYFKEGDNALNLAIKSDNFRDIDERREVIEILLKTGCLVNSKDLVSDIY